MPTIKILFLTMFIFINLNAKMKDNIVFVEEKNSEEKSLKDEFLNPNSNYFTISICTLDINKYDPIEYFRIFNMKNAVAYKFGDEKEFARVIYGAYKSAKEAKDGMNSLDSRLLLNKPYVAKLSRHQELFAEYNGEIIKKEKIIEPEVVDTKTEDKPIAIANLNNSIFISDTKEAEELKKEFLNTNSNYYSIAIGSISLSKNSVENFLKTYNVEDKALAHTYGKNNDKVRIIYGLYKTKKEAQEALKNLNSEIKKNSPFASDMKRFQSFYQQYNQQELLPENIVEFKINEKEKEKSVKPTLSDEIKILKAEEKIEKKELVKEEVSKPKVEEKKIEKPKSLIQPNKKIVNLEPKPLEKIDSNEGKFLKKSKLIDVYYVEDKGEFNILSEVFLNDGSSFYTIDFGELKLDKSSLEQFFVNNSLTNNALAYKYGDNKEFARVIYGAFETKDDATNAAEKLNVTNINELKISNIKNHQNLYKVYHENRLEAMKKNEVITYNNKKELTLVHSDTNYSIVYSQTDNSNNLLKDEFFNRNSTKYTITLITFLKDDMDVDKYFAANSLYENALAYPIGTVNSYYRIIYGVYNSADEAKIASENLSEDLKKNIPYISRINTNQNKFESYNGRVLEEELPNIRKIEFR